MLNTDRLCLGCMNDNGGEAICGICGYDSSVQNDVNYLPAKFWVNDRYLIGKVLSVNGEGITYIGWDNGDDSIVNVREYFPTGAAVRNADKTVSIVQGSEFVFNEGLMEFKELGGQLIDAALPGVVPVSAVFEENGTCYTVYKSISGITLKDFLTKNGGSLKWEQTRPLFMPLIDTVKALHSMGIIHRAISPDTILVGRDGKLRVTGICVKGIRNTNTQMQPQIYPGFAAVEQYGFENLSDGAYTDVYGICATLFRVLIGAVPPEAIHRMENDQMSIPARFAEELPRNVLTALANGLQVLPADRTADLDMLKKDLTSGETAAAPARRQTAAAVSEPVSETKEKSGAAKYAIISAACTAGFFLIIAAVLMLTVFRNDIFGSKKTVSDTSEVISMPKIESVGTVDSSETESITLYDVPELLGKYYSQLADNEEYDKFKFVIKGKEFSTKYPRGTICSQSVAAKTGVEKDTTVELMISLGNSEIKIADVVGKDEISAKLELLKQGFLYENIEVVDMYDSEKKPDTIIDQNPKHGTAVTPESAVKIYINTYKGDESSDDSDDSDSNYTAFN